MPGTGTGAAARGWGGTGGLRGPSSFRRKQCPGRRQLRTRSWRGRAAWILSRLPPLFLPLLFLPPGCISLAPPLLINSSHTSLLSLASHWRVPSSQRGADAEPHCLSPSDCSLPGRTCHSSPLPPPSREAWALRDRGPKATAPHPTLKQRLGVSNDSSHSEHDLLLTGGEKTVA